MATLPITDDLLAEIFLRLPTSTDLVRAAAACPSFRRVATARSFIRRFRRHHAPLFLGFVDHEAFHHVVPSHPSAQAARALVHAADFSFSFLPSPGRWDIQDARDGRILLDRAPEDAEAPLFTDLTVCDPLHRRYLLLPPVPKDLEDLARSCSIRTHTLLLAPPGEEEEEEETSFRVIWIAPLCETKPIAFIFSSSTGQWRSAASQSWSDLPAFEPMTVWGYFSIRHHYAYGCFYWQLDFEGHFLAFHTRSMEFSIAALPPEACGERREIAIVEAGEDRLGMFALDNDTSDLYYTIRQNNQWKTGNTISLGSGYQHSIAGATERYLLLLRNVEGRSKRFTLDIRTLQLERMYGLKHWAMYEKYYTNFPPSILSLPTV